MNKCFFFLWNLLIICWHYSYAKSVILVSFRWSFFLYFYSIKKYLKLSCGKEGIGLQRSKPMPSPPHIRNMPTASIYIIQNYHPIALLARSVFVLNYTLNFNQYIHTQECQTYADLGQPSEPQTSAGQWVSIFWTGPSIEEVTR